MLTLHARLWNILPTYQDIFLSTDKFFQLNIKHNTNRKNNNYSQVIKYRYGVSNMYFDIMCSKIRNAYSVFFFFFNTENELFGGYIGLSACRCAYKKEKIKWNEEAKIGNYKFHLIIPEAAPDAREERFQSKIKKK